MIRWFHDLAFIKNVCVGAVHQTPAAPDSSNRGMVQKQAPWQAYGMAGDWKDTDLGNKHDSKKEAMEAVTNWYLDRQKKHEGRMKSACSAHYSFRPGCVFCEALNK